MALRRAVCVSASLMAIFSRHNTCSCSTTATATTTQASETTDVTGPPIPTTTLWIKDRTSARDVPLLNVEDMFGEMDGVEDDAGVYDIARPAAARLSSSLFAVNPHFCEWEEESENGVDGAARDLSLESLMNAALEEPCVADDTVDSDVINNGTSVVRSAEADVLLVADGTVDNLTEDMVVDDNNSFTATEKSVGAKPGRVDGGGGTDGGVDGGDDDDDEETSSLLAEEEEREREQVEQLLCASQSAESLFFKDKPHVVKSSAAKPSFDDAAAEGAELESVGEAMPSPQRS